MNTEDRKRLAGCIAILSGITVSVIAVVVIIASLIGLGVKVFHLVAH